MTKETTFFSYSRSDSDFVLQLAKDLRDAGADLWLDQLDIKAGSRWDASIEAALNSASRLIVILSPASVDSNNVMDEVNFALENSKTVIPVLLSECTAPFRLRRLQRIDFSGDYQKGLKQLLEVLGYTTGSNNKADIINQKPGFSSTDVTELTPVPEKTNDDKSWEDAKRINSIFSYKKYINETESGLYKEKALQFISKLESEQKDKDLENLLWEKARAKNTLNALQHYLAEYPKGNYKSEALSAIHRIENENISDSTKIRRANSRKYIFLGVGVIITGLGIWGILSLMSGKSKGNIDANTAVQKGDSSALIKRQNTDSSIRSAEPKINDSVGIGKKYHGGIIIYVDGSGQHGLIAAKKDIDIDKQIPWGNGTNAKTVTTNTEIYTGKDNTDSIIALQGEGYYAARKCAEYKNSKDEADSKIYTDWYLPSKEELDSLFKHKDRIVDLKGNYYWSSSEYDIKNAYFLDFRSGRWSWGKKNQIANVRAVRRF